MKSIFFALFFVVFTYAQVITFTNHFVPTYEGSTATNLIRVTNNGKFFNSGKNTIQSIKFRISVESAKPKSASAVFNPTDEKFFGAIVGEADGFFYFNVNGLNGTYQCELHMQFVDWKGKTVKVTPYKFAFTVLKKKAREEIGRIRPSDAVEVVFEEGKTIEATAQQESSEVQARQTSYNPDCPIPSTYEAIWQPNGCNLQAVVGQSTSNVVSFKNQLPSGSAPNVYNVMANITFTFTGLSPNTQVAVSSAPTIMYRKDIAQMYLNIGSYALSCTTYFTINMKYLKASGSSPTSLVYQPGGTIYTWSTTFNPVYTYPASGTSCPP